MARADQGGQYERIPAERGTYAFPDPNPLVIGSHLVEPYYFSYGTAAFFHALSTQAWATVYIATDGGKTRSLVIRDKEYRVVGQPKHQFFGATAVEVYGSLAWMAEPEKTVLDSLERPPYAGGLPEVAAMLHAGRARLDWDKLAHSALRFRSQALLQRLGYLVDLLGIQTPPAVRATLQAQIGKATTYLGVPTRWGRGGDYDANWQIVDNVPRHELLAEIQVR